MVFPLVYLNQAHAHFHSPLDNITTGRTLTVFLSFKPTAVMKSVIKLLLMQTLDLLLFSIVLVSDVVIGPLLSVDPIFKYCREES